MNIKRIQKSKNYSIISNEILRRKDLSLKAKGLMSLILSLPDSWDLTVNGLVEIIKESKNTVYTVLKELNKFGYVERNRITDSTGKVIKWELLIYEQPHTKKPQLKKPDVEKCTQINTNTKINTKRNKDNIMLLQKDLISIREMKFGSKVSDLSGEIQMTVEMANEFLNYWTEPTKSKTNPKMKWELERTFDIKRRLLRWEKNSKKWNRTKTSKIDAQIDSYVGALNLLEEKYKN